MHVKLEPSEQFDFPVDLITDIESDLFREHLFGNTTVSNSDFSESSSDDDHLSKLPFNYESFPGGFSTDLPSFWDQTSSSRSSSTSGSHEQALSELDSLQNSSSEINYDKKFNYDELDLQMTTCSPQEVLNSYDMKRENSVSPDLKYDSLYANANSPNHVWDMLFSNDIKPSIKTLETPPTSPPESTRLVGDTFSTSPCQVFSRSDRTTSLAPNLPSTAIITVSPVSPKPPDSGAPPEKKVALAPKIPFKIVTTITAKENNLKNVPLVKTINIQPKSSPIPKPTISILNSSVPKYNITKAGPIKTIVKVENKPLVQKPLVITTSQSRRHSSTPISTTVTVPSTSNVSTCAIIPEQKPLRLPLIAPALNPAQKQNSLAELRLMKRQQRMIKNRESASLSRKRKKEYLQGLEDKVQELDMENARLKAENEKLLRKVTSLENERVIMRAARFPIKRSSTAILGLTFLLLFNISPMMNLFKAGDTETLQPQTWNGGGKALLPEEMSRESERAFPRRSLLSLPNYESLKGLSKGRDSPQGNVSHICPVNFNTTESLRIENELRDWFDLSTKDWRSNKETNPQESQSATNSVTKSERHSDQSKKVEQTHKNALAAPLTSVVSSTTYQYLYRAEENAHDAFPAHDRRETDSSQGVIPLGASLQSLLEKIERRNDTYYVVSLTADHLLLPASAHNTSARPKMSLLVPTPKNLGDHGQMGLMQIDCEVTHTRLVQWRQQLKAAEVNVAGVANASPFHEGAFNATDVKEDNFRKEKEPLKKRRRKKT